MKTEIYSVDWIESNCTEEDMDCGRYEEGEKDFNNYQEAFDFYYKLTESRKYNVYFTKTTCEKIEEFINE